MIYPMLLSVLTTIFLSVTVLTNNPVVKGARISVDIREVQTGRVIEQYQPNTPVTPASTTKLITTATALQMLGPDHRLKTTLCHDGDIRDGVLHGNLYIVGGCDPTLMNRKNGRAILPDWVRRVQAYGIRRIEGRVIADMSMLDSLGYNPHWMAEDKGNYYAPCVFSLAYLSNTIMLYLESGAYGSTTHLKYSEPNIEGFTLLSRAKCTGIDHDGAYVSGKPLDWTRWVRGQIPSNRGVFCVKSDMPNPGLLLARDFSHCLDSLGVAVAGVGYTFARPKAARHTIYEHQSPSLRQIIRDTNEDSNNLYAEMLARYLPARSKKGGSSCRDVSPLLINYWRNRGVNMQGVVLRDGCGLAPANKLTASVLVDVLTYMRKGKYSQAWYESLPISGETGTLTYFCDNTPLQGRVHAKSGTMSGTKCFAGYITAANGQEWVFAVMVSGAQARAKEVQRVIESYLLDVYQHNG